MKLITPADMQIYILTSPDNTTYFICGEKLGETVFANHHDVNIPKPVFMSTDKQQILDTLSIAESEGFKRHNLITIHLENFQVSFSSQLAYIIANRIPKVSKPID